MRHLSNRTWNTMIGYCAAVVFAGITGFALGATFSTGCPTDAQNAPFGCVEFLLSRYQTMIAAAIAAVAVFPVWRQARLQGTQTDILRIEALGRRVALLTKNLDELKTKTDGLRGRLQEYPEYVKSLSFWVHDRAQEVDGVSDFVSEQGARRLDGARAVVARADLIDKMEKLSRALWVINWDVYIDDEYAPSEERQAELRAEAADAEAKLEGTINAVLKSSDAMHQASLEDIADARTEVRALNDLLLSRGT